MCSLRHHTRGASPPRHKKHFSRCTIEEQPFIILILKPTGLSYANNHSQPPPRSALQSPHQPSELDSAVEEYFANGITLSTRTAYTSALKRYISFCNQYKIEQPFPLSEISLCRFAAFFGQEHLKHRTYLSRLRFAQIHQGMGNPFTRDMPRLEYVLTGIKRAESRTSAKPRPRLPVTLNILSKLKEAWPPTKPDHRMLWAAACTGFFGFLRAGEFTVPSRQAYDPEVHLNLTDLAIDCHDNPTLIRLRIKQSKTYPFRQGVEVFLGATKIDKCPVQAILSYLEVRSSTPGALFMFSSGHPLTRSALVSHLQSALQQAGFNHKEYNGHSFRIGAEVWRIH